jgi:hypothetical protein
VLPLPAGYASFNGIVYDVRTEAVGVGPTNVQFKVPTAGDSAVFSNLRILHLEKDSFDAERLRWVDRTILIPEHLGEQGVEETSARSADLGRLELVFRSVVKIRRDSRALVLFQSPPKAIQVFAHVLFFVYPSVGPSI